MSFLLVFVAGGLGASARHGVNLAALRLLGPGFPWGTLLVNAAGGVAMGVLAAWLSSRGPGDEPARLLLATGLLGGFTTFSAFSLDAVTLWQRGDAAAAILYVVASVLLAVGGLVLGSSLARVS